MSNIHSMPNDLYKSDPMTITVQVKSVYGNETIYPHCDTAVNFAKLLGQKTLTRADLELIRAIGFTVKQHHEMAL